MRKETMTKNNDNQNCQYMTRRIGSTTYKVKVAVSYTHLTLPTKLEV